MGLLLYSQLVTQLQLINRRELCHSSAICIVLGVTDLSDLAPQYEPHHWQ